jgi:hypothetical protein
LASANIVGYQNLDSATSGFSMISPTFLSVNSTDGSCTLADLKVTGYSAPVFDEEEEEWTGGCAGRFYLQFLDAYGQTSATYRWYDNGEKAAGWYTATGAAIAGGASSVTIKAGQAVWCQGFGYKLVTSGSVNLSEISKKTETTGFTPIGNGFPVDVTLADLTVTGYSAPVFDEEEEEWTGGCAGRFYLQFLDAYGQTSATYRWYDNGEKAAGWYTATGAAITGGASSVKIKAGQGVWIQGAGYTLKITSPVTLD